MKIPDITGKNVLIIGCPASGKTLLSNYIKNAKHRLIHTDDFLKYGHKESLISLLEVASKIKYPANTLIEGSLGYRLLKKGVETDRYYPDMVIELVISNQRMEKTYKEERPKKDIDRVKQFHKNNELILKEYLSLENKKPPEWVKIKNDY